MTALRLALIGCGFIGRRHLENVALRDDVVLEAAADLCEETARASCREFKGRYFTTEPEQIFEDRDIDAVIICTHHDSHTSLAVRAAAAGKHVLLEKPMALTASECRDIAAAAAQAGIVLTLDFKFRFAPAVLKVREVIKNPIATHGQLCMERMPEDIWVRDPVRGGGLILATACHALDMLYWLNQSEPVRVHTESLPAPPEEGINVRAATASVRFANGAVASLLMADAGENPYVGKWLHEVFDGKRSAALYDHFRQVRFSNAEIAHYAAQDEVRADGTFGLLEDFVQCIRRGKQPIVAARDGLRATLFGQKLLESARSGRPEEIQLDDLD